ncbi:MAG: hypothetical protein KDC24_01615 [Saprospiraceae bacterium]|nr:hypothetical protein [Saprospiraceae bacterium]
MRILLFGLFLFFSFSGYSQLEKTIHQTFAVDKEPNIQLDIYGDYELIPWAGDHILTETNIQLYEASEGILEHFLKIGRYEMVIDSTEGRFSLVSKDKERRSVKTSKGECYEFVNTKVFVPDAYGIVDKNNLIRKEGKTIAPTPDEGG